MESKGGRDFTTSSMAELARAAGNIHLKYFNRFGTGFNLKADNTQVTLADLAVHDLVADYMMTNFPDIGIVGEEGSHPVEGAEYEVVVDELDGTGHFANGTPLFTYMMGYCHRGKVKRSVVYYPFTDLMFIAEEGKGARVNGVQIHGSKATDLKGQTIAIETTPRTQPVGLQNLVAAVHRQGAGAPQYYAAGYAAMQAAFGHIAGVIFHCRALHDSCASSLILQESGLTVTDLYGKPPSYSGKHVDGLVAAGTPQLHRQLLEVVQSCL